MPAYCTRVRRLTFVRAELERQQPRHKLRLGVSLVQRIVPDAFVLAVLHVAMEKMAISSRREKLKRALCMIGPLAIEDDGDFDFLNGRLVVT